MLKKINNMKTKHLVQLMTQVIYTCFFFKLSHLCLQHKCFMCHGSCVTLNIEKMCSQVLIEKNIAIFYCFLKDSLKRNGLFSLCDYVIVKNKKTTRAISNCCLSLTKGQQFRLALLLHHQCKNQHAEKIQLLSQP